MIKRLILTLSSIVALAAPLLLMTPAKAACVSSNTDPLACVCGQPEAAGSSTCAGRTGADPVTGSTGALTKAIELVSFITGVASVIIIVLGGLQYIMSMGDSAKINKAKDTILYAVIGLIISVLAQVIVRFVVKKL